MGMHRFIVTSGSSERTARLFFIPAWLPELFPQPPLGLLESQSTVDSGADRHEDDESNDQVHEKFFGRHASLSTSHVQEVGRS